MGAVRRGAELSAPWRPWGSGKAGLSLGPNAGQRIALVKHVGAARFTSNGGLARCLRAIQSGRCPPSAIDLHREWNRWQRTQAPWWAEVPKCAPRKPSGISSGPSGTGAREEREDPALSGRSPWRTIRCA
ncbi:helix-turn-helix domain-containing protein [Thermoflexus sp.]|uniref:helix-turn-helix domain-containing protein n=1 Tax=Thermoflexus sp. TaxID=1969742 RepID=UPI0035E3FEEB